MKLEYSNSSCQYGDLKYVTKWNREFVSYQVGSNRILLDPHLDVLRARKPVGPYLACIHELLCELQVAGINDILLLPDPVFYVCKLYTSVTYKILQTYFEDPKQHYEMKSALEKAIYYLGNTAAKVKYKRKDAYMQIEYHGKKFMVDTNTFAYAIPCPVKVLQLKMPAYMCSKVNRFIMSYLSGFEAYQHFLADILDSIDDE